MKRQLHQLLALSLLACLCSCNTARKAFYNEKEENWEKNVLPADQKVRHTLFLSGGAGEAKPEAPNPLLELLEKDLSRSGDNSTIVFLGDNTIAFNQNNDKNRLKASAQLDAQLAILEGYNGKVYFIPGEQDWNNGRKDGRKLVRWQEEYIESRLNDDKVYMPGGACGGANKEKIDDDLVLIFIDSQWWLQDWSDIENINEDCDIKNRFDFLLEVEDDLKKYDKEKVVFISHHPFFSNGPHGGNFAARHHLFPLTLWNNDLYIPLPGLGSLAVLLKQMGVSRQDIPNSKYLRLWQEFQRIIARPPHNRSVIFAGAHDNSLQFFSDERGELMHLISGSAGKAGYARQGHAARFVHARQGYSKLYFYDNNEVWLEFIMPVAGSDTGQVVFRKKLYEGKPVESDLPDEYFNEPLPDSVTVAVTDTYEAGKFRKVAFGNRYRQAWSTPVTVPVFNMDEEFSNLKIVQQGGGKSTRSLRLEADSGRQYVLRSVFKDVRRGRLPTYMYRTILEDFVVDMQSGLHPYAAFVIPPLAEAAGIFHTNPRLYYLPRQKGLGVYNSDYGGELYLFEERPDDNHWKDYANFGNSADIISTQKLLDKRQKSSKNRVDEKWVLKSRLFDMWINDRDRHEDQWRWASFAQSDGTTLYRPIPRDRDMAFFDLRGVVPWVGSRRFLRTSGRGFTPRLTDIPGQNKLAKNFDRSFLTGLDHEDWMETASALQSRLTDEAIDEAFKVWPPEIYRLNGPEMGDILKARRNTMLRDATKLYRFHARYVDVVGTDKRDLFRIVRREDGSIEASIYQMKKSGEVEDRYYHRIFKKNETREIRLFGLKGDDRFELEGKVNKSIFVRIIGGDGNDKVEDKSKVTSLTKKTIVYDTPAGMTLNDGDEIRDLRADRLKVNEYDRREFYYDSYFPMLTFGRTVDDGFLFGGGVRLSFYRFRKQPYGIQHVLFGRFSANTDALNLRYTGDFIGAVGGLDFNPELRFDRPIIFNFFGLGNGTLDTAQSNQFNWVRLEKLSVSPLLKKKWYNGRNFTRFGPFYEKVEVENRAGRITDTDLFTPGMLEEKDFLGFRLDHRYEQVDNATIPRSGLKLVLGATYFHNLEDNAGYGLLEGNLSTYMTIGSGFEVTLATRIGAASLTNENFQFYHSAQIGGNNYLRGFRNNRFAGQSLFYHNTDVRIKLFFLSNKVMPFEFGLVGGFDYGRVWTDGDEPEKFHSGISPGFWFTPYKLAVVNTFYTFTSGSEDDTYTIRLGFYF